MRLTTVRTPSGIRAARLDGGEAVEIDGLGRLTNTARAAARVPA